MKPKEACWLQKSFWNIAVLLKWLIVKVDTGQTLSWRTYEIMIFQEKQKTDWSQKYIILVALRLS